MFEVAIFRVRHVFLTAGLAVAVIIVAFMSHASAAPDTLTVRDPRPVAKALEELGNRYGWQITYEDLPYAQLSGMPDVIPLVQENAAHAAAASKGTLSFALPSSGQTQLSVVESVVKAYNASSGGNTFAIMQGARLLHVVPQKVIGVSGNGAVKPILDAVISVEPKERTAFELLEEICQKVSTGANASVVVGTTPTNMLMNQRTSAAGSGVTARSILESLILESGKPLSWELFYDPEYKLYALNISVAASAAQQ